MPELKGLPKDLPVHFVGIGGIGMSGLASILLEAGLRVTGSDLSPNEQTERLAARGAIVWPNHRSDYVAGTGLVVVSSAIPPDNPELRAARSSGIPVLKRAELLGLLAEQARTVAVAGTHGKTTTGALIASVLKQAGWQPGFVLGGEAPDLGGHARWGGGQWLVVEADEYDRSFHQLHPQAGLVTNIELDHPDCYADLAEITQAFHRFLLQVEGGPLVVCADSPPARALAPEVGAVTYGLHEPARWRVAAQSAPEDGGRQFSVAEGGRVLGPFRLRLAGEHNLQNALGAVALTSLLGVPEEAISQALAGFRGTHRRLELIDEAAGVAVLDDYAHHPSEIRATLQAARERYGRRRLWAHFQPHTFSRTRALLADFAAAFQAADRVLVSDIYPARERPGDWKVHSRDLVAASDHPGMRYVGSLAQARDLLLEELGPGDVLLTLGPGDVWRVARSVAAHLRDREPAPTGD